MQNSVNYRKGGYQPEAETIDPSFRILKDLADDLTNRKISFPTFINATMRIRRALADPKVNADRVANAILGEPLLAAKLVQVANSAAIAGLGKRVTDVKGAVIRVGFSNLHSIATALAMTQLVVAKEMQPFLKYGQGVWKHSLDVAAIAFVVAKKLTRLNPDEALFAGLVHDVGRFYLLSKMPKYPELAADPAAMEVVIAQWHAPVGHAVLGAFEVSDAVLEAVADHESMECVSPPKTMLDVVVLANALSKTANPLNQESAADDDGTLLSDMRRLLDESSDELTSLVAALGS
jgi:putative nucleotidyltransferase with HDIG domain